MGYRRNLIPMQFKYYSCLAWLPWIVLVMLFGLGKSLQAQNKEALRRIESLRILPARAQTSFGKIERWEGFRFDNINSRTVEIWLPPQPYWDQRSPLPVWYLHDGQNMVDAALGYGGSSWEMDSLMELHLRNGLIPPCILVMVDNSPRRFEEYLPPPCYEGLNDSLFAALQKERPGLALGDLYAQWLVEELVPWIMVQYPVYPDARNHYLMGASMGGLISSYAALRYPQRFGGAVCLSTHWPLSLRFNDTLNSMPYRAWLLHEIDSLFSKPNPSGSLALHSLYMDHGDQTLDAFYPPHQKAFDRQLRPWLKTHRGQNLRYNSRFFPGTKHHEKDWSARCIEAMVWTMQGQDQARLVFPFKGSSSKTKSPTIRPPKGYTEIDKPIDWQIYFVMTDRFADGESRNNLIPTWNPKREHYFHGGDFEGIRKERPYLKSLGINALWITPPVWNQDFNPDSSLTGYHGYWATHFGKTDPRLGSPTEFRRMSKALKRNGIALIQDVVVNHTGDYFDLDTLGKFRTWNQDKPMQAYLRQWPIDASASQRREVYHRSGPITNYNDSIQRLIGQMSGLDDLNTSNPWVQRKLKRDYRRWIRWGSLSGMRFDTPLYVEHAFWKDFLKGMGIYSFGELWTHSPPWSDGGERLAASYLRPGEGMDGALQFPLQKTILEVLDGTCSSAHLSYRLEAEQINFPLPQQRVHFLDNHDMPRMSTRLDSLEIAQALLLLYSLPGIPVLYYGTESALKGSRDDYFDASMRYGPYRGWIQTLSELRHREASLKEGKVEVILDSRMGTPAWIAWVDRRWLIALNPTNQVIQISDSLFETTLPLGTRMANQPLLRCGVPGYWNRESLVLNPGEGWVWAVHGNSVENDVEKNKLPAQRRGFSAWPSLEAVLNNANILYEIKDSVGDDLGSDGQIQYPKAFEGRSGDLKALRWMKSDAGYILEIQMLGPLSTLWNPPHGFDHLNLHIKMDGVTSLEYRLDGWNGSGSTAWEWFTDAQGGKVYALFPQPSFVPPHRIRVRTWDSDGSGEPRSISIQPGSYEFQGNPSAEKWMDEAVLKTIP